PWSLLPELRGRPVTVAPSASAWLAAKQSRHAPLRPPARSSLGPAGASGVVAAYGQAAASSRAVVRGAVACSAVPASGEVAASGGVPASDAVPAFSRVAASGGGAVTDPAGAPLLVAGPGLAHAEAEVAGLAGVYPGARVLAGAEATVAAALTALDGVPVAHFA